jgi:hypothetical protein
MLGASLALAESHAEPAAGDPTTWQVQLTPYAWFAGANGSTETPLDRFPGRSFAADFDTIFADVSAIPIMGMAEIRYGRLGLVGDLLYLQLSQNLDTRDVGFRGGHSLIDLTMGNVVGLYRLLDMPNQTLDAGLGVRLWSVSAKLSLNPGLLPGVIQKRTTTGADPLVAARYRVAIADRVALTAYGDIGGHGGGANLTWQAIGSIDYRASESITVGAGWRYLAFDITRGAYSLDLGLTGPFIAATLRF